VSDASTQGTDATEPEVTEDGAAPALPAETTNADAADAVHRKTFVLGGRVPPAAALANSTATVQEAKQMGLRPVGDVRVVSHDITESPVGGRGRTTATTTVVLEVTVEHPRKATAPAPVDTSATDAAAVSPEAAPDKAPRPRQSKGR
jgi:hypothetical protein